MSADSQARKSCTGTVETPVAHRYGGVAGATYLRHAIVAGMPQVTMPPRLRAVFDEQRGLVSRAQALEAGIAPEVVQRLVVTGEWRTVRRGFYTEREWWENLEARDGRPRLAVRAAYLGVARPHVVSHDSAALFLGLPTLAQPAPLVHLTRLGPPRARTQNGIRYHQSRLMGAQRLVVEGLPVLDVARTAVDIAREHPLTHGVVAIDAARQLGVSLAELWSAMDPMYRWPGITTARLAVESSDAGAESVGETLARMMLDELGIGPCSPSSSSVMPLDAPAATCGWVATLSSSTGARSTSASRTVALRSSTRSGRLGGEAAAGLAPRLPTRHVTPRVGRVLGDRRRVAMARLAREYEQTCATFGTSIDDLAHLVVRRAA